jgi:cytochrome c
MSKSPFLKRTATVLAALALSAMTSGLALAEGDVAAGEKTFKKCKACHKVDSDKHGLGPSLNQVIGRTPGTVDGFKYTPAMIAFGEGGAVWDEETLSIFLEAPKKVVPKTKMSFRGLKKPEDRENVIAYIKTFSE